MGWVDWGGSAGEDVGEGHGVSKGGEGHSRQSLQMSGYLESDAFLFLEKYLFT